MLLCSAVHGWLSFQRHRVSDFAVQGIVLLGVNLVVTLRDPSLDTTAVLRRLMHFSDAHRASTGLTFEYLDKSILLSTLDAFQVREGNLHVFLERLNALVFIDNDLCQCPESRVLDGFQPHEQECECGLPKSALLGRRL